jgi:hypothetical protein
VLNYFTLVACYASIYVLAATKGCRYFFLPQNADFCEKLAVGCWLIGLFQANEDALTLAVYSSLILICFTYFE